jgi:hypothetical protein
MRRQKSEDAKRRGPEPDVLKLDEPDWEVAVKKALMVKRPAGGWPARDVAPRRKRKSKK